MGDGYTWLTFFDELTWSNIALNPGGGLSLYFIPMVIYKLVGFGAGYVFGLIYFFFAIRLTLIDRKYLILFCLPILQLFAGYIEIYAPVYAMSVATYYYYLQNDVIKYTVIGGLCYLCHMVIGLPVIILVSASLLRRREYLAGGVILIMVAAHIYVVSEVFTRESALFAFSGYYSMFSSAHLTELAGLFTCLFLWMLINWQKYDGLPDPILSIAVLSALGLTLIVVPHVGMLRDWDLMSISLFPVTFLYLAGVKRVRTWVLVFMLTITTGWLAFNHSDPQTAMLDYMTVAPQYSPEFYSGHQLAKTLQVYQKILEDHAAQTQLFYTRIKGYDEEAILKLWETEGYVTLK